MVGALRKFLAQLIYSNRFTRAVMRRVALDEYVLGDLLSTERIRTTIRRNDELRRRLSSLAREIGVAPPRHSLAINSVASSPAINDVSPALSWGPHPFPLTRHALLWRKDQELLCERWMRRLGADATVVLFFHTTERADADVFAGKHPQIKNSVPFHVDMDESEWAKLISLHRYLDAVALVLESDGLTGMYPLFQGLWRTGFRQFVLLSELGICQIEISKMPDTFKGIHQGKPCFIFGESFDSTTYDFTSVKGALCISGNGALDVLIRNGIAPAFWLCADVAQITAQCLEYLDTLPAQSVKLIPLSSLPLFQTSNICPLSPDNLPTDTALLQWSLHLGCNPIHVAGIDISLNEPFLHQAEDRQISILDTSGNVWGKAAPESLP